MNEVNWSDTPRGVVGICASEDYSDLDVVVLASHGELEGYHDGDSASNIVAINPEYSLEVVRALAERNAILHRIILELKEENKELKATKEMD
jgi:hypothetical protein